MIIDSGVPGISTIYDRAVEDMSREDIASLTLCSQMPPLAKKQGKLASRLFTLQEKLGNEAITVVTNRTLPEVAVNRLGSKIITHRTPKNRNKWIHAKALVIRYKDGSSVSYATSSDFSPITIAAGFSEIALRTEREDIADMLEEFMFEVVD